MSENLIHRRIRRGFIALCFVAAGFAAPSSFAVKNQLHKLPEPVAVSEFELQDLDDHTYKLSDYLGKPLIVNFWASWCPPCRAEMPSMNRAWHKIKDEGISLLAINTGEDYDAVFGFFAEMEVDFPLLIDSKNSTYNNWSVRGLPTTFVLNSSGEIVYRAVGEREWDDEELLAQIRALL